MFPCLDRVDWDLLHRQKLVLLTCLSTKHVHANDEESLRGIVHLLDALQDDAEAACVWTFPGERVKGGA